MGNYTVFSADNKFLCITFLGKIHNTGCRAHIIGMFNYIRYTFRVNKKKCIRMSFLCFFNIAFTHSCVSWATTA